MSAGEGPDPRRTRPRARSLPGLATTWVLALAGAACSSGGGGPADGGPTGAPVGAACAADGDCGSALVCITEFPGGYCLMVGCGPARAACPEGSTCVGGDAPEGGLCLASCDADVDCREAYRCTEGVCVRRPTQGAGGACGVGAELCLDGLVCVIEGEAGQGTCFAECAAGGALCDGGRECLALRADLSVCVAPAAGGEGDVCDGLDHRCLADHVCLLSRPAGPTGCRQSCMPAGGGAPCAAGQECVELDGGGGACVPPPAVEVEGECGGVLARCIGELVCVDAGAGDGRCLAPCDPEANPPDCTGTCAPLEGDGGACIPAGTVPVGGACGGFERRCAAGGACVLPATGAPEGTCRATCDHCAQLATGSAGCEGALACMPLTGEDAVCLPPPAAPVAPGEPCGAGIGTCDAAHVCVDATCLKLCNPRCTPDGCAAGAACAALDREPSLGACRTASP